MRAVIAEDAVLLREGLVRLLEEGGFDVVDCVDNGEDLLRTVQKHQPDVCVVDVRMPPTFSDEGVKFGRHVFAVNRGAAESDLRIMDQNALRRLLPVREWVWIRLDEDLVGALSKSRQGIELWRHLLLAALLLMVVETALAQLFGRRA